MPQPNIQQTRKLISIAIKDAIDADSYFLGLVNGKQLQLKLFYDDGELYLPANVPLEESPSGWVISSQQSLFIADLWNDVELDGVKLVILRKEKTSLCWMGVPLHASHVNGIICVAKIRGRNQIEPKADHWTRIKQGSLRLSLVAFITITGSLGIFVAVTLKSYDGHTKRGPYRFKARNYPRFLPLVRASKRFYHGNSQRAPLLQDILKCCYGSINPSIINPKVGYQSDSSRAAGADQNSVLFHFRLDLFSS